MSTELWASSIAFSMEQFFSLGPLSAMMFPPLIFMMDARDFRLATAAELLTALS